MAAYIRTLDGDTMVRVARRMYVNAAHAKRARNSSTT